MADPTFEGEVESLTPSQKELISEVLRKRGHKVSKVIIDTLGKAGDNFVANVKSIDVELVNGETFKLVAKIAPTNEILRATMGTIIVFGNEVAMYNEILPKFVDLQIAAGLSEEESFHFADCYGSLLEPKNEIVLLGDLREKNYVMLDRFTPLTNESVKTALTSFAKLHSLSFALKKKYPDTFESYRGKLRDFFGLLCANPGFRAFLSGIEADTIAILDSDNYKNGVRNSISQLLEQTATIIKYDTNSRYSVVTHGDGWTNNLLYILKDEIPVDAILIDYQLSKVASPVCDLLYMIFTSTDHSTRHRHYYEWIDFYHSQLDNCLSNFGLKASLLYPRDQLDADLRRYSKAFFSSSILLFTLLSRKTEDAAKMKESMESNDVKEMSAGMRATNLDKETAILFKGKIEGLVDSYREFGYME